MAPSMSEPRVERTGWLELSDVERSLAELRGLDGQGSVRATTLNLVVHCGKEDGADATERVLEEIGGSRPLRAIVIAPTQGAPRARVSSTCWAGPTHEVCTERIAIRGARAALPSAVISLLVADLPVFVWWRGELPPEGDPVLGEMIEMATRMVVDSDETGLDAVVRVERLASGLADLGWARTAAWREAIAALFDGRRQRSALDHLIGIDVKGPPSQAALIAGWLRSRLHRQVGLDTTRATRLNRIELLCGDERFLIERSGRYGHGTARGPGLPERTVALPSPTTAALLAGELDRLGAERPFGPALEAAA
jgi:glucose-6-phosphate dehydrogenase assembly protein OpcA